jgi:hypothetical protein
LAASAKAAVGWNLLEAAQSLKALAKISTEPPARSSFVTLVANAQSAAVAEVADQSITEIRRQPAIRIRSNNF